MRWRSLNKHFVNPLMYVYYVFYFSRKCCEMDSGVTSIVGLRTKELRGVGDARAPVVCGDFTCVVCRTALPVSPGTEASAWHSQFYKRLSPLPVFEDDIFVWLRLPTSQLPRVPVAPLTERLLPAHAGDSSFLSPATGEGGSAVFCGAETSVPRVLLTWPIWT